MIGRSVLPRWPARLILALCVLGLTPILPPLDAVAQAETGGNRAASISYGGGDGRSCEAAILVRGARNSQEGIRAERTWIARHRPGLAFAGNALTGRGGRMLDVIVLSDGDKVCFDVTEFFGT